MKIQYRGAHPASIIKRATLVLALIFVPVLSHAALVTGSLSLGGGGYALTGGTDFLTATGIEFDSTTILSTGTPSGDLGSFVGLGDTGTVANFDFDPLTSSIPNFIEIGGFSFQLDTAVASIRSSNFLFIGGTGILTGNGFDPTPANWSFSSNNVNDYSMTLTAIPVPAAVWLFASGLLGLVGIARRRRT